MDIRKVKKLIELLEESGVSEIEIREGEESVRITRGAQPAPPATARVNTPPPATAPPVNEPAASRRSAEQHPTAADYAAKGHVITAPMVGIFYTAPSPDDPDFVAKGQTVQPGAVVCIIEAMKIMNQIEADAGGKLLDILVENGEAVEYGQPLFVIEPD